MLGARRILVKYRQHLHPLSLALARYKVEFGGDVVQAGASAGRL
jgi:hypothetical protein